MNNEAAVADLEDQSVQRRNLRWTDSDYFSVRVGRSRGMWELAVSLVIPPHGHRTVPTKAGWMLIFLSLGIGMAAYNTSSNILFMTLSLMLSSLVLSGILSVFNFKGIAWRLHHPSHLRAGEPTRLQIEVENRKRYMPTYGIWFRVRADGLDSSERVYLEGRLEPGGRRLLDWHFTPARRGLVQVEIIGMESQYPFGFLRKVIGAGLRKVLRVWPARIEYGWKPPRGKELHIAGQVLRKSGSGSDLISLRDYRSGDPPRRVHWKASARVGRLMVRELADEVQSGFIIHLETARGWWQDGERFENLCSLAATLAEDLFRENQLLALAVDADPAVPVRKLNDLHRFLDRLSTAEPGKALAGGRQPGGRQVIRFRPAAGRGVNILMSGNEANVFNP